MLGAKKYSPPVVVTNWCARFTEEGSRVSLRSVSTPTP
jgi:hypothetical protein